MINEILVVYYIILFGAIIACTSIMLIEILEGNCE